MKLEIARLVVSLENAYGHEHRIYDLASQAAAAFAEHLEPRLTASDGRLRSSNIEALEAPAVAVDLDHTSDGQAARQIASAWLEALAPHLKA